MAVPASNNDEHQREKREHLPLTPELIAKINQGNNQQPRPGVLKSKHVSLIKKLAKSFPDLDVLIEIRGGRVCRIRHTTEDYTIYYINDYSETTTEDTSSLEEE